MNTWNNRSELSTLRTWKHVISEEGNSFSDFKLPLPDFHKDQFIKNCLMNCYVTTEEDFSPEKAELYFEANHNKLNQDQKLIWLSHMIDGRKQQWRNISYFGYFRRNWKTFTSNVIVSWIRMQGKEIATSAISGIAATLLYLGRTAHNRFKSPSIRTRILFVMWKNNLR